MKFLLFSVLSIRFSFMLFCLVLLSLPSIGVAQNQKHEIKVHAGQINETVAYFKSRNFWGATTHGKDIDVPRIIVAVTSKRWGKESQKVPVKVKKELFYRAIVPMVLLVNELILQERQELEKINKTLSSGKSLSAKELDRMQTLAKKYRVTEITDPKKQVGELLMRVDSVPPSLALGQTAYESGYGTSRFAREGNALFGQWTFSGDGMKPKEHRASKGNYGVAAYKWPFESVRSYMLNLNTHNAYKGLRDKRAELRKQGKKPAGLALAETLGSYSEKGGEYVKTLKSIITVNGLEVADNAFLRDEPVTFIVGVDDEKKVGETESEIEKLRASGELDRIIESMRLDVSYIQ